MNKKCTICKEERPVTDFYSQTMKNGNVRISSYCKGCQWIKIKSNPNYKKTRTKAVTKYQKKFRTKIIELLGGKCVKCGFYDSRALQLDHINGGGKEDRKQRSWQVTYKQILSGEDKTIQLLCANCNWIKREENKECFGKRKI